MQVIGRREFVDFPELKLFLLEAKIDTGAYTTALHCHSIQVNKEDNKHVLYFKLLDPVHPEYNNRTFRYEEYSKKIIKNSFGEKEERYIIKALIVIAGKRIKSSISLSDRANMKYPVLIGRKLIRGKFIVDVKKLHTKGID